MRKADSVSEVAVPAVARVCILKRFHPVCSPILLTCCRCHLCLPSCNICRFFNVGRRWFRLLAQNTCWSIGERRHGLVRVNHVPFLFPLLFLVFLIRTPLILTPYTPQFSHIPAPLTPPRTPPPPPLSSNPTTNPSPSRPPPSLALPASSPIYYLAIYLPPHL